MHNHVAHGSTDTLLKVVIDRFQTKRYAGQLFICFVLQLLIPSFRDSNFRDEDAGVRYSLGGGFHVPAHPIRVPVEPNLT
jgi:hypothetical protein